VNPAEIADRLRRQEDRNFDFKAAREFSGEFRAALTVDIAAMANTPGGGTLIVGVRKIGGIWTPEGVSAEQLASFDKTPVTQFVKNLLDPLPRFEIETVEADGKKLIAVTIVEFEDVPIVAKKTIQHDTRLFAKEGTLLIRSEAAESRPIQSADEFRQLLGRAISRKSENLLAEIRSVVTGAGPRRLEKTPAELFEEQLPSWPSEVVAFDEEFASYARWEVRILPHPAGDALEPSLAQMTLRSAKVSYRGWDFPALPTNQDPLFGLDHLEVRIAWEEFRELSLFSYQGAFGFASAIWTELKPRSSAFPQPAPPDRILDAIGILWSFTEFFRFALNVAEAFHSEGVWIQVRLKGIRGRKLGSFDPRRVWWGDQRSRSDEIPIEGLFATADLKGSWREAALVWAKKAFTVFQWPDPDPKVLAKAQEDLVERRL
jgi:hypothetical protein